MLFYCVVQFEIVLSTFLGHLKHAQVKCNFVFRGMCLSTFSHDAVRILASPASIAGGAPNCKPGELWQVMRIPWIKRISCSLLHVWRLTCMFAEPDYGGCMGNRGERALIRWYVLASATLPDSLCMGGWSVKEVLALLAQSGWNLT